MKYSGTYKDIAYNESGFVIGVSKKLLLETPAIEGQLIAAGRHPYSGNIWTTKFLFRPATEESSRSMIDSVVDALRIKPRNIS